MIALLGSACHFLIVSSRITAVEKKKCQNRSFESSKHADDSLKAERCFNIAMVDSRFPFAKKTKTTTTKKPQKTNL